MTLKAVIAALKKHEMTLRFAWPGRGPSSPPFDKGNFALTPVCRHETKSLLLMGNNISRDLKSQKIGMKSRDMTLK